jgi:hypothetical protein
MPYVLCSSVRVFSCSFRLRAPPRVPLPPFFSRPFLPVDTLMGALPAHFESDAEFARRLAALETENEAARAELRAAAKEGGASACAVGSANTD